MWPPTDRLLMLVVSVPLVRFPVATTVAPSRKSTCPAGAPAGELTVAVSETGWPAVTDAGVPEAMVVVAATTAKLTVPEVDGLKVLVPRYLATIGCDPRPSDEVMNV